MSGVDTGLVFNATTNDSGLFSFPNVPIGSYTLQANASGFQTYVQSGLELRVNEHVQVNIRPTLGLYRRGWR